MELQRSQQPYFIHALFSRLVLSVCGRRGRAGRVLSFASLITVFCYSLHILTLEFILYYKLYCFCPWNGLSKIYLYISRNSLNQIGLKLSSRCIILHILASICILQIQIFRLNICDVYLKSWIQSTVINRQYSIFNRDLTMISTFTRQ